MQLNMTLNNNKFLQKYDVLLRKEICHAIESLFFRPVSLKLIFSKLKKQKIYKSRSFFKL